MRTCVACGREFEHANWQCPACYSQPEIIDGFRAFAPEFATEGGGFKSEYFAELANVEAASFWFRSRNSLILWALRRYFPGIESLLEIGCGTGFVLSGIAAARPELRLAGSEIFARGLSFAAQRVPGAELMQMDARRIPYASEFDAVGAFDVLEHIAEDEAVLREICRALKPGGGMLLTVPQHRFLWSAADDVARHVRRYSAADLQAKVEQAGFRILRMTSFVSLLLPMMLVSRLTKRSARGEEAVTELVLARPLDALLENIMSLERLMIGAGLNFPVGGSLLLIASKTGP